MKKDDQQAQYNLRVRNYGLVAALALALALAGCGSDDDDDVASNDTGSDDTGSDAFNASELLANSADNVIFGIYEEQATQAQEMEDAVNALVDDPTSEKLQTARAEWVDTRIFWERSESALFGPVDSDGIDPRIDEWPLDESQLNQVLADEAGNIDEALIDNLPNNLRGFHVVEFLLWSDSDSSNDVDDPNAGQDSLDTVVTALANNPDRAEYLKQATIDLRQQSDILRDAWTPDSDNFGSQLKTAGAEGNTTFASQSACVEQLIVAMITIADEVGAGKISDPFSQEDPLIVESKHSFNSRTDFKNNIRGIKHIYLGDFPFQSNGGEDGVGVTDVVQLIEPSIDEDIRSQIDFAIYQIDLIDQPFRDSITGDDPQRTEIQNAIDAVTDLRIKLEQNVRPLLDEVTFEQ